MFTSDSFKKLKKAIQSAGIAAVVCYDIIRCVISTFNPCKAARFNYIFSTGNHPRTLQWPFSRFPIQHLKTSHSHILNALAFVLLHIFNRLTFPFSYERSLRLLPNDAFYRFPAYCESCKRVSVLFVSQITFYAPIKERRCKVKVLSNTKSKVLISTETSSFKDYFNSTKRLELNRIIL